MRRTPLIPVAAAAASLLATTLVPAAGFAAAAPEPSTRTLAKGLLSPLRAAVATDGTAYMTQDFMGRLMKVAPGKKPKAIYASKNGAEVGAVSVRKGVVTFAETASDMETGNYVSTKIKRISPRGKVSTLADLLTYEQEQNPDGDVAYGIPELPEECAAEWPTEQAGPPSYTGIVDSHPYATVTRGSKTYVADAAMNAVLEVSTSGAVDTVAVLPPTALPISAEIAGAFGLPDCAVGETYLFESVPTDVEVGPDGDLYVSSLGGAAGEAAPVGSVYRVDRATGEATQLFSGLMGAVGVAVARNGDIYATQLFGGSIVRVKPGSTKLTTFFQTALPAEVEVAKGKVYATINAMSGLEPGTKPKGKLVRFK